jgi:predicted 2-oxoglutarate/Fe(II)-dependent dioxygenase YbiX
MENLSYKVFAEKIYYYENALPQAGEIVDAIESTESGLTESDAIFKWKEWTASDDESYVFGYQKQTDVNKLPTSSKEVKYIYETLTRVLEEAGRHYCTEQGLEYFPPSPLSISKYIIGGSMGPHVDEYPSQPKEPVMSGVMYLNDDCRGGEIDFPIQQVRIKPKAGSIVIFPSVEPFYHQSLEVLDGQKYMSPVFWIRT